MAVMYEPVILPGITSSTTGSPLAKLNESSIPNTGFAVYPMSLTKDDKLKHYVLFAMKDIQPQGISKIETALGEVYKNSKQSLSDLISLQESETGFDPNKPPNGFGTALKSLSEIMDIQKNRDPIVQYIGLYMPDSLKDNYSSDYASISIRDEFGPLLNAIRSVASVADNASNSNKSVGTSVSNDPSSIKYFVDTFVGLAGGSGGIGEAVLQAQGYTSNPQLQMIYRGSHFRQFSLEFLFTPKSKDEAELVRYIIFLFKFYASPDVGVGNKSKQAMFLTPPALFEIKFMKGAVENINLPKYTDCVLEDVSVDYAPNGFASHEDGAPIQTHLTLTFQEVEIVDRERLSAGYTAGNTKSGSGGLR
jgi:hypothetical protein